MTPGHLHLLITPLESWCCHPWHTDATPRQQPQNKQRFLFREESHPREESTCLHNTSSPPHSTDSWCDNVIQRTCLSCHSSICFFSFYPFPHRMMSSEPHFSHFNSCHLFATFISCPSFSFVSLTYMSHVSCHAQIPSLHIMSLNMSALVLWTVLWTDQVLRTQTSL